MPAKALKLSIPVKTACPIDFVIVGGGLCGLACAYALKRVGHNVTVLEREGSVPKKYWYTTGCRLVPNGSKVLLQWGLRQELESRSCPRFDAIFYYDYEDKGLLCQHDYDVEMFRESGGGENVLISYGDFIDVLTETCTKEGVKIHSNSTVSSIDTRTRTVTISDGRTYTGDVIIGADGASGMGRKLFGDDTGTPLGQNMCSTMLPADKVPEVPEILSELGSSGKRGVSIRWGNGYCLYTYPMNSRGDIGIHLYYDDDGQGGTWSDGPTLDMSQLQLGGTIPQWIQKLFTLTLPAVRCRSFIHKDLEEWVRDGRFLLVGEAAHPFPQGAIQSFGMVMEDAGVLGRLFSHLRSKDQIAHLLWGFQDMRQARCKGAMEREINRLKLFTLRDKIEQQARNALLVGLTQTPGVDVASYSNRGPETLWSYDCDEQGDDWWHAWGLLHERAHKVDKPEPVEVALKVEVNEDSDRESSTS